MLRNDDQSKMTWPDAYLEAVCQCVRRSEIKLLESHAYRSNLSLVV